MCLNETLVFTAVAPTEVKNAFLGTPDKIRIEAGAKLFKWTSFPLKGANGITPWWSFFERTALPSGLVADGFAASEGYAKRLSVSGRDYALTRSAVSERFGNSMDNLLLIQLSSCVFGFAGRASGQPQFRDPALANVFLIGGSCQLWIPNLTLANVRPLPSTIKRPL